MTRLLLAAALTLAACGGEDPEPVCGTLDNDAQCPDGYYAACPADWLAACDLSDDPDQGFVPTCIDTVTGDWIRDAPVWCEER